MTPRKAASRHKSPSNLHKLRSPRIIIKFGPEAVLPYEDNAHLHLVGANASFWNKMTAEYGRMRLRRLFTRVEPGRIKELAQEAMHISPGYVAPDFLKYFIVDCPSGTKPEALAKAFRKWKIVEKAYVSLPFSVACPINVSDEMNNNGHYDYQNYLQAAPEGVDAFYVWPKPGPGGGFKGGSGEGQRLLDIEYGWRLDHEDLKVRNIPPPLNDPNSTNALYRDHGTSVLGIIAAADNDRGCLGIVPEIGSIEVAYVEDQDEIANAVMEAVSKLAFGDVLLIELHVDYDLLDGSVIKVPAEVQDDVFEQLELAFNKGIVVVEPAGTQPAFNGEKLENIEIEDASGGLLKVLDRNGGASAGFRDSGAIVVSGAETTLVGNAHPRHVQCNWGSRVNCYAQGEKVVTCTTTDLDPTTAYRDDFDGSSSASAIIAGVALAVQGLSENNAGFRYDPAKLRNILSNPSTGTASVGNEIGVMPDLRKIATDVLGLSQDVYMRDWIGDTGDPHNGPLSCSPDIIVRTDKIALPQTPQEVYGEGSGTENCETLSEDVDSQKNNYLYVRVRNRGGSASGSVEVKVYWSYVSTLPMPGDWKPIGSATIPSVPAGNILTVSDAIEWKKADIPGPGHYCFIALLGTPADPAPDPAVLTDWNSFTSYIAESNNVTWRNFNVVDYLLSALQSQIWPNPARNIPDEYVVLPFEVPGAADRELEMKIEVCSRFPLGSHLWLEAETSLAKLLCKESPYHWKSKNLELTRVRLNPSGCNALNPVFMPPGARMKFRLNVHLPSESGPKGFYECYVRQLYREREIGRVTWRLKPPHINRRLRTK